MQLDATSFPIVWMRDHDHGADQNDHAHTAELLALLARGERFVMIADKMPNLSDVADESSTARRERAILFKKVRGDLSRLCAGIVLIGSAAGLPLPVRKAIEGMMRGIGVAAVFAADEAAAVRIAQERLAA